MAHDWNIRSRSEDCQDCEKPFEDNEIYFSCLIFDEEGYSRADYCQGCREAADAEAGKLFSSWQGVFHIPPPAPEEALKRETAESLLRQLMEDDDGSKIEVMYVLTVMLERKKTFIERDVKTNDNGDKIRIYEHKGTGETFVIIDPMLMLDELEDTQEQVVVMLGGKPRKSVQPEDAQEDTTDAEGEKEGQASEPPEDEEDEEEYDDDDDD